MVKQKIEIEGNEYVLNKTIKDNMDVYVEYRNNKVGKIKFFKVQNGKLKEEVDKEKLKEIIKKNYILEENM